MDSNSNHNEKFNTSIASNNQSNTDADNIESETTSRKFAVIYPDGSEPIYFPLMEFMGPNNTKVNELDLIRLALELDCQREDKRVTTFYFFSPPGLGKTVLGSFLARMMNCPYQIINCVSSMIDLDLLGSHVLIGDHTKWQDGPLPSIIRATNEAGLGILLINELNALTVNAQMALNPLLDRLEGVVLTQNNNELVKVNGDSHLLVIATMNPDVLGINELQDSVRDRASAIVSMGYPSIEKESDLINKIIGFPLEWCVKYCEVISECRRAKIVDKTITKAPSTRALIDWVNYTPVWGPLLSFELTIANRYCSGIDLDEKEVLMSIARGKNVAKWEVPGDFAPSEEKLKEIQAMSTSMYMKKLATISKVVNYKKIPDKAKKTYNKQKLREHLNLSPLDAYMPEKKTEVKVESKVDSILP